MNFSGRYSGQVVASLLQAMLREVVLLQSESDLSDSKLLDAVGEIANALAGNARKTLGPELDISLPLKIQGMAVEKAHLRRHRYVITLRWGHHQAMVRVALARRY